MELSNIGDRVFAAEAVIDRRRRKNKKSWEYLVKWKNYSNKHNTWEPEHNILDKILIENFLEAKRTKNNRSNGKLGRPKKPTVKSKNRNRNLPPIGSADTLDDETDEEVEHNETNEEVNDSNACLSSTSSNTSVETEGTQETEKKSENESKKSSSKKEQNICVPGPSSAAPSNNTKRKLTADAALYLGLAPTASKQIKNNSHSTSKLVTKSSDAGKRHSTPEPKSPLNTGSSSSTSSASSSSSLSSTSSTSTSAGNSDVNAKSSTPTASKASTKPFQCDTSVVKANGSVPNGTSEGSTKKLVTTSCSTRSPISAGKTSFVPTLVKSNDASSSALQKISFTSSPSPSTLSSTFNSTAVAAASAAAPVTVASGSSTSSSSPNSSSRAAASTGKDTSSSIISSTPANSKTSSACSVTPIGPTPLKIPAIGLIHQKTMRTSSPPPELWKKQTKLADQILITDVTSNNMTITVRECKTYHGFFKEHPVTPNMMKKKAISACSNSSNERKSLPSSANAVSGNKLNNLSGHPNVHSFHSANSNGVNFNTSHHRSTSNLASQQSSNMHKNGNLAPSTSNGNNCLRNESNSNGPPSVSSHSTSNSHAVAAT